MVRIALALVAAVAAGACHSYSSGSTGADLILIGVHAASDAAEDCDVPRASFEPIGAPGASPAALRAARLTGVALVYRKQLPRRPHSVIGTVRARVAGDSCRGPELVDEIRDRASAEGCDAVVVGDEVGTSNGGARMDGACVVFSR